MGKSNVSTVTPVVQAAAYAAGNVVGGILPFLLALDADFSGVLQSASLKLKTVQTTSFNLWLFGANPAAGTYTDKTAAVWNDADLAALITVVSFTTYQSLGDMTIYEVNGIGKVIEAGFQTVYGVLIAGGAATLGSTSDVIVDVGILKD